MKFIETGGFGEILGGNAPLIVHRDTSELTYAGTAQNV